MWDENLPDNLLIQWEHLQRGLRTLTTGHIPRGLVPKNDLGHYLELHVFCDASESAYAAAVYSRVLVDDVFQTALLASKSRVAPLKPLTVCSTSRILYVLCWGLNLSLQFSALLLTCHMKPQY